VRRPRVISGLAAAAALLLAAGCTSDGGSGSPTPSPSGAATRSLGTSPSGSAAPATGTATVTRTLATDLDTPWGLAPLPGGDLLVSSRDTGRIYRISSNTGAKTYVGLVPGVSAAGEGGLLGIALSPDFGADRTVYAYFTTDSDNRIARMLYDDNRDPGDQLGAPDTIFRGIPKGEIHNGGRIAFGPDKMLYAGTGESGDRQLAQDPDSPGGKILRMTPDGRPAQGNPDPGSVVYSPGHRNVQGLAWDNDGRLWASEFGQDTWDELNRIQPGKNYGWPTVEGKVGRRGFQDPVEQWKPAENSPSGIAYAKGSIWMAGLRGERLWRIPLHGTRPAGRPQAFFVGRYGRLRTVVATDDGGLWVTTSNTDGRGDPGNEDDRILRIDIT
jgi:aldose sugar dehydrogenase